MAGGEQQVVAAGGDAGVVVVHALGRGDRVDFQERALAEVPAAGFGFADRGDVVQRAVAVGVDVCFGFGFGFSGAGRAFGFFVFFGRVALVWHELAGAGEVHDRAVFGDAQDAAHIRSVDIGGVRGEVVQGLALDVVFVQVAARAGTVVFVLLVVDAGEQAVAGAISAGETVVGDEEGLPAVRRGRLELRTAVTEFAIGGDRHGRGVAAFAQVDLARVDVLFFARALAV